MAIEPKERALLMQHPDPTTLTHDLVLRAVASSREILEARLDGNDKALDRLDHSTDARLAAAVIQVKEFYAEKFHTVGTRLDFTKEMIEDNRRGVEERFLLLKEQTIRVAADVKSTVEAAFAHSSVTAEHQNDANTLASQKQDAAFTKQIDQLALAIQQVAKANDEKLNDLKDRIGTLESRGSGARQQRQDSSAWLFAILAAAPAWIILVIDMLHR
jgi:hypothetical protein